MKFCVLRAGEAFVQDRRADGDARFRAFAFTVAPSETVTRGVGTVPSEGYDLPFQWDDPTGRGFGGMIE